MFLLKWRRQVETDPYHSMQPTVTGGSRYTTREAADRQVSVFTRVFPFNSYYVEPCPAPDTTVRGGTNAPLTWSEP